MIISQIEVNGQVIGDISIEDDGSFVGHITNEQHMNILYESAKLGLYNSFRIEPNLTQALPKENTDMTYTSHGHHIDGTILSERPNSVARCGGPRMCSKCQSEVLEYKRKNEVEQNSKTDYQALAKKILRDHLAIDLPDSEYDFYIVWFSKVLQNWKALLCTDIPGDNKYFEMTYNGDKNEVYIDEYHKYQNTVVQL